MYPALTVLQALFNEQEQTVDFPGREAETTAFRLLAFSMRQEDILWVGGLGGMEVDLVKRAGIPFEGIPAAGVHGVGLRALPGNMLRLMQGILAARRIIHRFRPNVLFFTGGYVAVPMAIAGWGLPSLLYVPDIEPGLALKTLARFAACVAVTTDDSRAYFSDQEKVHVSGYPVRLDLAAWTKERACQALSLTPDIPTLLVIGGSKGARSINRAILAILPDLLAEIQIVHISGNLDWAEVQAAQAALQGQAAARYRAYPYLHEEIGAALCAADLAIARAGASTLGEFPLFGLPAILVPYPYAWRYQQVNASYLEKNGAAAILTDADMSGRLLPMIQGLMRNRARRQRMSQAMRSLAHPEAASAIGALLTSLANLHPGKDESRG